MKDLVDFDVNANRTKYRDTDYLNVDFDELNNSSIILNQSRHSSNKYDFWEENNILRTEQHKGRTAS